MHIVSHFCFLACLAGLSVSAASAAEPENSGPNTNITRWASGKHAFRAVEDQRMRGEEHFRLSVHPDGTRTMAVWKDLYAVNSHIHALMRVDREFRPLEAFADYWQADGHKGSIRITVDGRTLHASGWSPVGPGQHTFNVPEALTVITHGEGFNGWGLWPVLNAKQDQRVTAYNVSPARGAMAPVLGTLTERTAKYLGEEEITVPAGTFKAARAANELFEVWVTIPDRILVRQLIRSRGLEFVLVEMTTGSSSP